MKKLFAILLAAMMLLTCSALAEDTGLADIMAKGQLIMGFDEAYPPMGFVDENGDHVGFDIDLAKEVAKRMGVELVLQPISWDAKELELSGGNIDCIWSGLTITEERKAQMLFTMPYLANEQIMVVMADSGIASVADTAGKVLGTQAGSASVDVLEANPEIRDALSEVALSDDFVAALMDLKLGGIDVLLIDSVVGNYYIAQQDDPAAFTVLPEVLQDPLLGGKGQILVGARLPALIGRSDLPEDTGQQRPAFVGHTPVEELAGHRVVQTAILGVSLVQLADDLQILGNTSNLFFHKGHLACVG